MENTITGITDITQCIEEVKKTKAEVHKLNLTLTRYEAFLKKCVIRGVSLQPTATNPQSLDKAFNDCFVLDPTAKTPFAVLYKAYSKWCERNDVYIDSKTALSVRFQAMGLQKATKLWFYKQVRAYKGIRLRDIGDLTAVSPQSLSELPDNTKTFRSESMDVIYAIRRNGFLCENAVSKDFNPDPSDTNYGFRHSYITDCPYKWDDIYTLHDGTVLISEGTSLSILKETIPDKIIKVDAEAFDKFMKEAPEHEVKPGNIPSK